MIDFFFKNNFFTDDFTLSSMYLHILWIIDRNIGGPKRSDIMTFFAEFSPSSLHSDFPGGKLALE